MFTRKTSLYFGLAGIILILSLVLQDWQLASLILPIAVLISVSNIWGLPEHVDLEVDQEIIPSDSFGDEEIAIKITVSNRTNHRLENVDVRENLPDRIQLNSGSNSVLTGLEAREKLVLMLTFHSPMRGHYGIGPLVVKAQDPFGFYLVEKKSTPEILSIMPRPERIRGAMMRPRHIGPWPGTIPARTMGPGTEFYSIRDYVSGDDPKKINWKTSAKRARLVVNEMETERVTDVMIVLDTDISFYEIAEEELFERGVGAAASMVSVLLRQGNRVGLILQGEERGLVAPAFGKQQERKILHLLAAAKPGRALLSTSYVITLLARLFLPARAQIVMVSPLLDPGLKKGIETLAASGYSILVLSPSPKNPTVFESEQEEIAYRMLLLERSNMILALEKVSTVVQWHAGIPLSTVLREVRPLRPPIQI